MTKEERENALHCLKVMIDEGVCEECKLYGTTGTDHCEADCVRVAIQALEQEPSEDCISRKDALSDEGLSEFHYYEDYAKMRNYLKSLPSVQPKTDYKAFAEWVASEIFSDNWEYNKDSFAEIACRKLNQLGIVASEGDAWKLKESEVDNDNLVNKNQGLVKDLVKESEVDNYGSNRH